MSVISLSSEDDCVILESDDEDFGDQPLQPHQVFIVQSSPSSSYIEEADSSERIHRNPTYNLAGQFTPHRSNDKIAYSNGNSLKQNYNEVPLYKNIEEVDLSNVRNQNKDSDPIEIQNTEQLVNGFNPKNNRAVGVLKETKESGFEIEVDSNESQRDLIFNAVQLTSVSRCIKESKSSGTFYNCHTQPLTDRNKENKSQKLKVLAEKLSQVLGRNNKSIISIEHSVEAHQETNISALEKTILDVSKGIFENYGEENRLWSLITTSHATKNRCKTKRARIKKQTFKTKVSKSPKFKTDAEISNINMQPSINLSKQIVSQHNSKVEQVSPQATKCFEMNCNVQPLYSKITTNVPKSPLNTCENIDSPKRFSNLKRNKNILLDSQIKFKSTSSFETKKYKTLKTCSPEYELKSTNQTNIVKNHKTKDKELKCKEKQRIALKSKKKSKKNLSQSYKLPSENCGPYVNKLKFTFDRSISVYSVAIVSPTTPQEPVENLKVCQNNPQININTNEVGKKYLTFQKSLMEVTKTLEVAKNVDESSTLTKDSLPELKNDLEPEVLDSGHCRNLSMPFSNMQNLKNSFVKHYYIVFDDQTDALCIEMGFSLLQSIEESKNLQSLMENPNNDLSKSIELKNTIQTCQDVLYKSKRKFINNFSQVHNKINIGHIIETQLKIVFLTAWFMKMFLSITSHSPDLMDILHDFKINSLDLLSDEIVKWPLVRKTFIKDDHQFECDCLLVLELIKDCLKDCPELDSPSNDSLTMIRNVDKSQDIACITLNSIHSATQPVSNSNDSSVEVIKFKNKKKVRLKEYPNINNMALTTNESQKPTEHEPRVNIIPRTPHSSAVIVENETCNEIADKAIKHFNMDSIPSHNNSNGKQIESQYLKELVSNTECVNQQVHLPINIPSSLELNYRKNQLCGKAQRQVPSTLKQSKYFNPSEKYENYYQSNYSVKLCSHQHQNHQYYQPNLHAFDTNSAKYPENQDHFENQAHYQESVANQNKITIPTSFQKNSYTHQVPIRHGNGIDMSIDYPVCNNMSNTGVTINNYNIINYSPHILPDQTTLTQPSQNSCNRSRSSSS